MKTLRTIFIICFFVLLALPAVTMPFSQDEVNTEKRELSEFPAFWTEDGLNPDFSEQLTTWIQEHIGFRSRMVSANSTLRAAVFGQSSEDSILVGRDGWLYYADTVPDYLKVSRLSARNLTNTAAALRLLQEYAEDEGAAFAVALIPNKNSLYGERMPANFKPLAGEGTRKQLENALAAVGVHYADVEAALKAVPKVLYQETDSHWTYEGALYGYRAIMDALGVPYEPFDGLSFAGREDWEADLATALYGTGAKPGLQLYPERDFAYEITSHETAVNALTLTTVREGGNGSLVMYRDSFLNTMQVYAAESFEQALFSRVTPYQADLITKNDADAVVLEIVERNIADLASRAPVMAAPERELKADAALVRAGNLTLHREESGSFLHFFGTLPEELLGDSYKVFFVTENKGEKRAYEAFPIFEREKLGADVLGDNGWSLYLPQELMTEGAAVGLCWESAGETYYYAFN